MCHHAPDSPSCSLSQSCVSLQDPMGCSPPGLGGPSPPPRVRCSMSGRNTQGSGLPTQCDCPSDCCPVFFSFSPATAGLYFQQLGGSSGIHITWRGQMNYPHLLHPPSQGPTPSPGDAPTVSFRWLRGRGNLRSLGLTVGSRSEVDLQHRGRAQTSTPETR